MRHLFPSASQACPVSLSSADVWLCYIEKKKSTQLWALHLLEKGGTERSQWRCEEVVLTNFSYGIDSVTSCPQVPAAGEAAACSRLRIPGQKAPLTLCPQCLNVPHQGPSLLPQAITSQPLLLSADISCTHPAVKELIALVLSWMSGREQALREWGLRWMRL